MKRRERVQGWLVERLVYSRFWQLAAVVVVGITVFVILDVADAGSWVFISLESVVWVLIALQLLTWRRRGGEFRPSKDPDDYR